MGEINLHTDDSETQPQWSADCVHISWNVLYSFSQ